MKRIVICLVLMHAPNATALLHDTPAVASPASQGQLAALMAAADETLQGEGHAVARKALGPDGFIVETVEAGTGIRATVAAPIASESGPILAMQLTVPGSPVSRASARGRLGIREFGKASCRIDLNETLTAISCPRALPMEQATLQENIAALIAMQRRLAASQTALRQTIESRSIIAHFTPVQSWEEQLKEAAVGLETQGYYVDELSADADGAHLLISSGIDDGLFLSVYVLPTGGAALFAVSFHPSTAFGELAEPIANEALIRIKNGLLPRGCPEAIEPSGFCNTYGYADEAMIMELGFDVRPFQGAETLLDELRRLEPYRKDLIEAERRMRASRKFRPALQP